MLGELKPITRLPECNRSVPLHRGTVTPGQVNPSDKRTVPSSEMNSWFAPASALKRPNL